jgi:hypothetical protein
MKCPHCGKNNLLPFAMVCRFCDNDMSEPASSANLVTSDSGAEGDVHELDRIANALERIASATEKIFHLMLIVVLLSLSSLGVILFIGYWTIP